MLVAMTDYIVLEVETSNAVIRMQNKYQV